MPQRAGNAMKTLITLKSMNNSVPVKPNYRPTNPNTIIHPKPIKPKYKATSTKYWCINPKQIKLLQQAKHNAVSVAKEIKSTDTEILKKTNPNSPFIVNSSRNKVKYLIIKMR